jgi:uncharacterized protein (DUF433 family)
MAVSEVQNSEAQNRPPSETDDRLAELRRLQQTAPPITTNPERMGGTPVIGIERLPVSSLIDHLMGGYTVDEFIEAFQTDREKVMAALQRVKDALDEGWLAEKVDY